MGKSCSRWNSGWLVRWRNLKKRVMKTIAVVTMNTDSRPASRGSRGEIERWRGLVSTNKEKGNCSESQLTGALISPASLTFISNIELSRDLPVCGTRGASACCRGQGALCGRGAMLWQEGRGCDVSVLLHVHGRRWKGGEGIRVKLWRGGGLYCQRGWKGLCWSWKMEKPGIKSNAVRKYVALNTDSCFQHHSLTR